MVYEIPKCETILKAFEYANEDIPKIIRLNHLRKICNKNLKDWKIPIKYQYVWYCLNEQKIKRKTKRQIFNSKVTCYPFYIEMDKNISKIINSAVKKLDSRKKFAELVNRSIPRVCDWINGRIRIPITALLKACQILNKDPWIILNGKLVSGQGTNEGFVFENIKRKMILDILTWIKLEGHVALEKGRIEIEQKDVGKNALLRINKRIKNKFKINTHFYRRKRKNREGWIYTLRINSSPLKQILFLKYGIDFGYKSPYVDLIDEVKVAKTKSDKLQILVSAMETEGHFGFARFKKYVYPRCNFTSSNKITTHNIKDLFSDLGFTSYIHKKDEFCWRVVLTKNCLKFYDLISPYITHQKKLKRIMEAKNLIL